MCLTPASSTIALDTFKDFSASFPHGLLVVEVDFEEWNSSRSVRHHRIFSHIIFIVSEMVVNSIIFLVS